jgi:hypothetical protein
VEKNASQQESEGLEAEQDVMWLKEDDSKL